VHAQSAEAVSVAGAQLFAQLPVRGCIMAMQSPLLLCFLPYSDFFAQLKILPPNHIASKANFPLDAFF